MSEIENAARPLLLHLISGNGENFDRHQQTTLATWLSLKAMIWDSDHYVDLKSVPQADRDFLFQNRERPAWRLGPDWMVWCGKSDAEIGECGIVSNAELVVVNLPNGAIFPHPVDDASLTMCFGIYSGNFIAIVLRSPLVSLLEFSPNEQIMKRIWPISSEVDWPPVETVSVGYFAILVTRASYELSESK